MSSFALTRQTLSVVTLLVLSSQGLACSGSIGASQDAPWQGPGDKAGATSIGGPIGGVQGGASSGATQSVASVQASTPRTASLPQALPASLASSNAAQDQRAAQANSALFDLAEGYFPGSGGVARPRLFRLTQTQLGLTAKDLFPGLSIPVLEERLPSDPLETNYEYSDNLNFNAANLGPYLQWTEEVAALAAKQAATWLACKEDDAACLNTALRSWVKRAFRDAAGDDQVERFAQFFTAEAAQSGLQPAVNDVVSAVLTSPHFLFRDEVLVDNVGVLKPAQRLQHLTYALADVPPASLGFVTGMAAGAYASRDAEKKTLDTVLSSAAAKEKLVRFLRAWLEVNEPEAFRLDPKAFPLFTPELAKALVGNVDRFLRDALNSSAKLQQVTRGSVSLTDGALGSVYRDTVGKGFGIFTHPAFIASHSGPDSSRLVKRGLYFTKKALCLTLGQRPDGVSTTLPSDARLSERQRVESVTSPSGCKECHSLINPLGYMLEEFDAMGRFRTQDEAGRPIDASAQLNVLDMPLQSTDAATALPAIVASSRFKQCFVRQVFRFYLGRQETAEDYPVLRQLFFNFVEAEQQDLMVLLLGIAQSPQLVTRSETL